LLNIKSKMAAHQIMCLIRLNKVPILIIKVVIGMNLNAF